MEPVDVPCPACGTMLPVLPGTAEISRFPRGDEPGRVAVGCPGCARRWSVEVDEPVFSDLRAVGCDVAADLESRARHPAGRQRRSAGAQTGAPIGWDDLLDFHLLLERDDWFGRLCEVERPR